MTNDLAKSGDYLDVDYEPYEKMIQNRKITYESIYNNFCDDIFGEFANKITREAFKTKVGYEGWKWFDK